ncbi:hypothetical protein WM40_24105 [Robbsia andropogonis]|uniref:Uncharacterized protein n=1 Tax=Robbsia andropogonis TaxID=28092 RepID=A0A0F5JTV8_9BURK|nr:hypothetical protein WM40_24105 [Robbsia andropogonis]
MQRFARRVEVHEEAIADHDDHCGDEEHQHRAERGEVADHQAQPGRQRGLRDVHVQRRAQAFGDRDDQHAKRQEEPRQQQTAGL